MTFFWTLWIGTVGLSLVSLAYMTMSPKKPFDKRSWVDNWLGVGIAVGFFWPLGLMVAAVLLPFAIIALIMGVAGHVLPPVVAGVMEPVTGFMAQWREEKKKKVGRIPY